MDSSTQITILLVEDHPVTRLEIKSFLEQDPGLKVIAVAVNGEEAVRSAQQSPSDIILMDVSMPKMDGIRAAELIRGTTSGARIIMLTSSDSEQDIFASLAAGVQGYCLKDTDDDRLYRAILSVHRGDLWLDPNIARKVVAVLPRPGAVMTQQPATWVVDSGSLPTAGVGGRTYEPLSSREQEVLGLLVQGLSNLEMARQLVISPDTIKTHMRHIMEKLAVSDRTQAAIKALRSGLV